jgi:hypothetical protein
MGLDPDAVGLPGDYDYAFQLVSGPRWLISERDVLVRVGPDQPYAPGSVFRIETRPGAGGVNEVAYYVDDELVHTSAIAAAAPLHAVVMLSEPRGTVHTVTLQSGDAAPMAVRWTDRTNVTEAPGVSATWDTSAVLAGMHRVAARALDAAGNEATAVSNVLVDNVPPTCTLDAPMAGMTVGGMVTLTATATDATGIFTVTFDVDGMRVGKMRPPGMASGPVMVSWDSSTVANGMHTIRATCFDRAFNTAMTPAVMFNVSN